jgi:hypothetical protein
MFAVTAPQAILKSAGMKAKQEFCAFVTVTCIRDAWSGHTCLSANQHNEAFA